MFSRRSTSSCRSSVQGYHTSNGGAFGVSFLEEIVSSGQSLLVGGFKFVSEYGLLVQGGQLKHKSGGAYCLLRDLLLPSRIVCPPAMVIAVSLHLFDCDLMQGLPWILPESLTVDE